MVVSDKQVRDLRRDFKELSERMDDFVPRLEGAEFVASHHGDSHNDESTDPIQAGNVAGHAHAAIPFPIVRTTNTSTSASSTSHTVTLPLGILANDLLLVFFFANPDSGFTDATFPAGWTEFFSDRKLSGAYRQADGAEALTITVMTADAAVAAHSSYRIDDAVAASTQAPEAATDTGTVNPPTLNVTGGAANFLFLAVCGLDGDGVSVSAAPTDYTGLITASGTDIDVGSAQRELFDESDNPNAFNTSGDDSGKAAATIAVHPLAVAPGLPEVSINTVGWDVVLNTSTGTAIQDAFDAGARSILLLDSAHTASADITPPNASKIEGQSRNGTSLSFGTADFQFLLSNGDFTMRNITLQDSTSADAVLNCTSAAILIDNVRFTNVEKCFKNIDTSTARPKILQNCFCQSMRGAAGTPIAIEFAGAGQWLVNCIITAGGAHAVLVSGSGDTFIQGGLLSGNPTNGYVLSHTGTEMFISSTVITAASSGICLLTSSTGRVHSNNVKYKGDTSGTQPLLDLQASGSDNISGGHIDGGSVGIEVNQNNHRISGVEIRRAVGDGISIDGTHSRTIISGCNIHDNGGWGIDVGPGGFPTNTIIANNVIRSNTSGEIRDGGPGTKIGLNVTT